MYNDPEKRKDLIHSIFKILNDWKLDNDIQVVLLGLDVNTKSRELTKIKNGKSFPDEQDFMLRAVEILSISKALILAFPGNQTMADLWITTPSYKFNDCAPVEIMIQGLDGLKEVHHHLRGGW